MGSSNELSKELMCLIETELYFNYTIMGEGTLFNKEELIQAKPLDKRVANEGRMEFR